MNYDLNNLYIKAIFSLNNKKINFENMTKNEKINRNIGLSFDFLREIVKYPKLIESIEDGTCIEFIEKDFIKTEKKKVRKTKYFKVKSVFENIAG